MSYRHAFLTSILLLVLAPFSPLSGADIEVEENPVSEGSFGVARYKLETGEQVLWTISPKPSKLKEYQADGYSFVHFNGPNGKYTLEAIVVNFDKKTIVRKTLDNVTVATCGPSTIPPPDKKDPPPPPPPTGKYYFLIVRPDGPAHPTYTKIMQSPAWDGLRVQGHKVGAATLSETKGLNINLDGAILPVVVTLEVSADGMSSIQRRGPVPLPTTAEEIAKLPDFK